MCYARLDHWHVLMATWSDLSRSCGIEQARPAELRAAAPQHSGTGCSLCMATAVGSGRAVATAQRRERAARQRQCVQPDGIYNYSCIVATKKARRHMIRTYNHTHLRIRR